MYFLGLLGGCGQATTNRPYRLVSNDRRPERCNTVIIQHLRQLATDHFQRPTSLTLLERFTQTQHRLQTSYLRRQKLAADHLIRLTQNQATLRVTNQHPLTPNLSKLLGRHFTGQRPEAVLRRTILGANSNMLAIDTTQNLSDMQTGGEHRNLDTYRQRLHTERLD